MAVLLKEIIRGYQSNFQELGDKRTKDWPLMASPIPVMVIVASYLWFVTKAGPSFMKNRKPFQLDRFIQVYNLLQVGVCGYLALVAFTVLYGPWGIFNFWCEPLDMKNTDGQMMFLLRVGYVYFLTKILDLMDTVFFVLRRKQSQITYLHVYHHGLMVLITWYGMRFAPGGMSAFIASINSFVHTIMYAYYFVTNWNKEYKKNVWWKKHITQLQLFQFLAIFIHSSQFLLFQTCDYPRLPVLLLLPQVLFITVLFADFYWKTYVSPQSRKNSRKAEEQ